MSHYNWRTLFREEAVSKFLSRLQDTASPSSIFVNFYSNFETTK